MNAIRQDSKANSKKLLEPRCASLVRYYDPKYLQEITIRTNNGKFAFDPNDQELSGRIVGLLFLAATIYEVKIVAVHFMTNHYHGLFEIASSGKFCKFLMHFHGGLARLAHERLGSNGKFWCENKWVAVAQDEVSVGRRIRYILGQGVKAGLVDHPIQFPGVSCAAPMIDGKPLIGKLIDLTRRYRDAQLKAGAGPLDAYTRTVELPISPPRCWADLSPGELQLRYRAIADEVATVPLHVLRKTPLLSGPARFAMEQQQESLTQCYTPDTNGYFGTSGVEVVCIPDRKSEYDMPYEQGPPKAKKRNGKKKRMPYLLSANLKEVIAYEEQYLAVCAAYAEAKQRWRTRARSSLEGLTGPRFRLPPHTLVGTMPVPD